MASRKVRKDMVDDWLSLPPNQAVACPFCMGVAYQLWHALPPSGWERLECDGCWHRMDVRTVRGRVVEARRIRKRRRCGH